MAFQAPPPGQVRENRRILEQLEEQKKRLRMQTQSGNPPPGGATPATVSPGPNSIPPTIQPSGPDASHMTPAQRAALQHAHANSVGYFITQDSSFGNLILPVIPRLEKPQ